MKLRFELLNSISIWNQPVIEVCYKNCLSWKKKKNSHRCFVLSTISQWNDCWFCFFSFRLFVNVSFNKKSVLDDEHEIPWKKWSTHWLNSDWDTWVELSTIKYWSCVCVQFSTQFNVHLKLASTVDIHNHRASDLLHTVHVKFNMHL